jgi:hypothetical protein
MVQPSKQVDLGPVDGRPDAWSGRASCGARRGRCGRWSGISRVGQLDVAALGALEHGEAVDVDRARGLERGVEAEVLEDLRAAGVDELAGEPRRGAGVAVDQEDLSALLGVGQGERLGRGAAGDAGADENDVVATVVRMRGAHGLGAVRSILITGRHVQRTA